MATIPIKFRGRVTFGPVKPPVTPGRTLVSVGISGPLSIPEGSSNQYTLRATYSDNTSELKTNTVYWTSNEGTLGSNGVLTVFSNEVVGDSRNVTIGATYSEAGITKSTTYTVAIQDTTPPPPSGTRGLDYLAPAYTSYSDWQGPITITQGGNYAGKYRSLLSGQPAVTIQTSQPVTFDGAVIASAGDCIRCFFAGASLDIQNTKFYGLDQTSAGVRRAKIVDADKLRYFRYEHNYSERCSGIYLAGWTQDASIERSIVVRYNHCRNVDGKYLAPRADGLERETAQFFQTNSCQGLKRTEISWNMVVNEAGIADTEDNINIFQSWGASALDPILIHNNYLFGSYPRPVTNLTHAGGGIMLGDGGSGPNSNHWIKCYDNHILENSQYGIGMVKGYEIDWYNNRIVATAVNPNDASQWIPGFNVGMYLYNDLHAQSGATYFHDIRIYGNKVAYNTHKYNNKYQRNDFDFGVNEDTGAIKDATRIGPTIYIPFSGADANTKLYPGRLVTQADINAEKQLWRDKVFATPYTLGPS